MAERTIIETQGVTKRFGGFTAVDRVTFRMNEGQAVGIIGPNGAGKTTFFNLLTGLFLPDEGTVSFFGEDITRVPPQERTVRGIVRTFQLVSVFDSLSVAENLVLAVTRFSAAYASKRRFFFSDARQSALVGECLKALGMMGLEQKARLMTSELSYGDKRKLEIAIALSMKPKILLLDEPFAGLSDAEIGEVLQLISEVKKRCSLVIIEHKISRIVDLVERLNVMHEGKLIAEGAPKQVLCDPFVREVYWGKEEGLVCSV
ncbi:MAG: ABC transporter ATP-binding protein [Nitrospirota bacterium]